MVKNLEKGWVLTVDRLAANGNYYVLLLPLNEGICWLGSEHVDFHGDSIEIAIATAPPTPTPSLTPTPNVVWRGDWSIWVGPAPLTQYFMIIEHDGINISGNFDSGSGNIVKPNRFIG